MHACALFSWWMVRLVGATAARPANSRPIHGQAVGTHRNTTCTCLSFAPSGTEACDVGAETVGGASQRAAAPPDGGASCSAVRAAAHAGAAAPHQRAEGAITVTERVHRHFRGREFDG